jgi:BirA family biotin operon repressor/biotin-[acetyl-CoA-carboxylase] ligase
VHEYDLCTSTNLVAAGLAAWSAVRAVEQTAGRGRFQRSWISDRGGLWLSAVLPTKPNSPEWRFLPLAVGLTVCEVMASLGVKPRLRWPNDVLVNRQKLAGILIDQFSPHLAVAGLGINVTNDPESRDLALRGATTSLACLLGTPPTLEDLTRQILDHLHAVCTTLQSHGPQALLTRVNGLWREPRPVKLDLDGREVRGLFTGVDADGRLSLRSQEDTLQFFEPQQVRLLRELD